MSNGSETDTALEDLDPLPDGSDFRIIIVDGCTTRWAPINNTFTKIGNDVTWDRITRLWNGVLYQLGEYRFEKRGHNRTHQLKSVTFERSNTIIRKIEPKKTWETDHLYWVNVATKVAASQDPMTAKDICGVGIDEAGPSIDRWFRTFWGGITLWARDWELTTTENSHRHQHFVFTVAITSDFDTKVYEDGQLKYDLSKKIDTIRINNLGGPSHGDQLSPPQYPPQQQT